MLSQPRIRMVAVVSATAFTALFLISWWNGFMAGVGVDSAFLFAARELLAGRFPYRDFGFVVPPLEVLKGAAVTALFPDQPIVIARFLGILERCTCAAFLMLWLTRTFSPVASFLAVNVSMVLFSASIADPMSGYNQNASMWAVIAGYFASRALASSKTSWGNLFTAGAACACALLTKQTTGVGICAAIGVVLLVSFWRSHGPRLALLGIAGLLAGWAAVLGPVMLWLGSNRALFPFIDQVFLQGSTAKGPLWVSLLRPLRTALENPWLRQEFVAAVALIACVYFLLRTAPSPSQNKTWFGVVRVGLLSLCALGFGYLLTAVRPQLASYARLDVLEQIAVFVTLIGSVIVTWRGLFRPDRPSAELWLFGTVSLAVAYMHSLSFLITPGIFIPGLAFLIAQTFHGLEVPNRSLARYALAALCMVTISLSTFHKWMVPYAWYGWSDAPLSQATPVTTPGLLGIRGGAEQQEFTTRLTRYLRDYSGPTHESYLFFYLPQFYLLSGTHPVTYSFTPFIDVASDGVARRDAETLRQHPPPVIGYTVVEEAELAGWENDFRAGKPSGQRDLIRTLDRLVVDYKLLDTLLMPGSHRPVRIYARTQ